MTLTTPTIDRPDWLGDEVYPFPIRRLDLPSGSVAYTDVGEGPALLFVHAGMWSFIFRDVIDLLRNDFRTITLDFPGYGVAPEPDAELDLAAMSVLLGELVDAIGLDEVTLVVHDLGGSVGMGWAAAHPDRVRGLVLANAFAWRPDGKALRGMLRTMSSTPITWFGTATNLIPKMTSTRAGVGRHLDPESRQAFLGPFRDRRRRRRFHRLMRSPLASTDHLLQIEEASATTLADQPVLTIFGERNDPFGFQDRIAATFSNHEGLVIDKGNHFPMMDDPALFAETLRDWWHREIG